MSDSGERDAMVAISKADAAPAPRPINAVGTMFKLSRLFSG
jgi:hypothetical protein